MKASNILPIIFFTFIVGGMVVSTLDSGRFSTGLEISSKYEGLPKTLFENTNPKKSQLNKPVTGGSLSLSSSLEEHADGEYSKMDPNLYEREVALEAKIEF